VIDTPSPRFIGKPGPADDGIPDPAAVKIRPPMIIADMRNPYIAVRSFIHPSAIGSQFHLILIEL
jgi:hypothetical protein